MNCLVTQVVVDRPVCVLARARQRVTASVAEQVDVDREADLLPAAPSSDTGFGIASELMARAA